MHLIAPTDTPRTIAQHELRGAVHLGLWPMGSGHPGEKVVANSRPLWPSFTGESEGKDVYTSFEVPEKRYEELDFFGKIIPEMFNKIVTLALEWTKSLKALPTSLSFPPRATISHAFAFLNPRVQVIILHSGKCFISQAPISFTTFHHWSTLKIRTLYTNPPPTFTTTQPLHRHPSHGLFRRRCRRIQHFAFADFGNIARRRVAKDGKVASDVDGGELEVAEYSFHETWDTVF